MSIPEIARFVFICLEVLLLFNLLIFVHELGHFLAARWRGLYVVEFALWFGKPLWRKKIGGVWYAINSIPAGGYVKLPQMAPMESLEGESEDLPPEAKTPIRPIDKIIVAFAGPLFSFLLACTFAVIVWKVGRPVRQSESTTRIGYVQAGSPAETAGLRAGDYITAIDGQPVHRWGGMSSDSIMWRVVTSEGDAIRIDYKRGNETGTVEAKPYLADTKLYQRKSMRQLLIAPADTPLVENVTAGEAAAEAGLRKGDFIVEANGQEVLTYLTIADAAKKAPDQPLILTVERDGERVKLTKSLQINPPTVEEVFPDSPAAAAGVQKGDRVMKVGGQPVFSTLHIIEAVERNGDKPIVFNLDRKGSPVEATITPQIPVGETKPKAGIAFREDTLGLTLNEQGRRSVVYPNPVEQIRLSALSIVNTLGAVLSPKSKVSAQHLGGPVTIFRTYYVLFQSPDGWRLALWFSVLLNVNLALLNLVPLPVLDGGHITLAIFEIIRRRPIEGALETRVLETVQTLAAVVLIGFMLFITFFDVQDLFGGGRGPGMKFAPKTQTK